MQKRLLHLFPGQGIQKVGMHQPLDAKRYLQLVSLVPGLQKAIEEGPQEVLNQTEYAQPAIFIASYLRYEPREHPNQYAIGHSVGEYTALTAAGHIAPENAVRLLHARGCIMKECTGSRKMGMLAINSAKDFSELARQLKGKGQLLGVAAYNSEKQTVYSGDQDVLRQFQEELKKQKVVSKFLEVSSAFHSQQLSSGKALLETHLRKYVQFNQESNIKVIRNLDAHEYDSQESLIEGLREQLDHPVQFLRCINSVRPFESIEYGSKVLSNLI